MNSATLPSFGRESLNEETVRRAAETANAHDFIESLEYGFQQELGEDGAGFMQWHFCLVFYSKLANNILVYIAKNDFLCMLKPG